jgi:GDSL-like Lipase/Acylhydrolase family
MLGAGLLLGLVEGFLRWRYGLGSPPLYVADARSGYRLAPNQRLRRFGNRIEINQYSMRHGPLQPQRPERSLRLLLLGDSIVNGGWWTDQSDLVSQQMQRQLAAQLRSKPGPAEPALFDQVEVLNASANSWGPRNQLGYLARFGTFEAQAVVLVLNTDDLFAIAPSSLQVGRDPSYPARKPLLAIFEVIQRRQPPPPLPELEELQQQGGDRIGSNLEAIRQMALRSQASGARLWVAMTPLRRELEADGPRDYELAARRRLQQFTQAAQIPYLDFLPVFQQSADFTALYRDHIHLSSAGTSLVSQHLSQWLLASLGASLQPQQATSSGAKGPDEGGEDSASEDFWR